MSDSQVSPDNLGQCSASDEASALFAHLVIQQSNMALMLLGKVAHPETGQVVKDLEAARLFIDQLEMLGIKTKGNLSKEEDGLLKRSLTSLRLAFVEAVESSPAAASAAKETGAAPRSAESEAATPPPEPPVGSSGAEDQHRKKFTKKY